MGLGNWVTEKTYSLADDTRLKMLRSVVTLVAGAVVVPIVGVHGQAPTALPSRLTGKLPALGYVLPHLHSDQDWLLNILVLQMELLECIRRKCAF